VPVVPVNSTHLEYDTSLPAWLRARDVLAGEDAVAAAGEKYLPRLDLQTDEEYSAYKARASFFGATAQTLEESQPLAEWIRRQRGRDMKKLSSTLPINSSRYLNLRYAHP